MRWQSKWHADPSADGLLRGLKRIIVIRITIRENSCISYFLLN